MFSNINYTNGLNLWSWL